MSVYNGRLQTLAQRAHQLMADSEELDESTWDLAYLIVLAALFDYEVNNGGFGQLIFDVGNQAEEAPTELGQDLTMVSIEYLRGDTGFADEIAEFLDYAEARL
ncbi:hypothetical protein [Nocardia carnea]|uniref:hypothetical protein n=1 Tax=Nocardia carnea TaxID=37328 RepID=UPI00245557B2|nr:hypothetical protein [Nocardia carnea]